MLERYQATMPPAAGPIVLSDGPRTLTPDGEPRNTIRLGMPHLGPGGLCPNWLLRECAHGHWHAIAEDAGTTPRTLVDRGGHRCFASIVSAVIDGPLHAFREGELARVEAQQRPAARTGWRGVTRIATDRASATVELVSAFARRRGRSNRTLEAADMPHAMRAPGADRLPSRSRVLRSRAQSFRLAAEADTTPLESVRVVAGSDFNGVGLFYFANFLRLFERVEATALRGPWDLPPVVRREIHWFGNADDGETLDLVCEPTIRGVAPDTDIVTFASVRRRSDGVVIAASDAERR